MPKYLFNICGNENWKCSDETEHFTWVSGDENKNEKFWEELIAYFP
jgi:hypothetical protein